MQTNVKTPLEVFTMPQQLVIPVFQRPYVWEEQEQWAPFWQDVREIAEAQLAAPGANVTHFLGAVVVQADAGHLGALPTSNVIDGQQRLTTLQLLMDAVEAVLDDLGFDSLAGQIDALTHNQAAFVAASGGSRLKLRHLNRDRTTFENVMEADLSFVSLASTEPRMARAHRFFGTVVASWLGDGSDVATPRRAQALVTALTRGLQLVVIDLGATENSQAIFETLNARGTPLSATDLIKNLVFQRLAAEGGGLEVHAQAWPFETAFWEKEVSAGRYTLARSSLFLNQWVISRTGEEVGTPNTFARFKRLADAPDAPPMSDLMMLIATEAKQYERWTQRAEDNDAQLSTLETVFYRLSAHGVEVLKPLLLWLYAEDHHVPSAAADRIALAADSWLSRRLLLRLPTGDLSRVVADVIRVHRDVAADELEARVLSYLAGLNVASTYWPGDAEIRDSLASQPTYRRYPRARLRMFLESIEDLWRAETQQHAVTRRKLPIEHVLPQAWNDNWPVEGVAAEQERDGHVHRLGNLTLLTKALNSKVSNGPWATKRAAFAAHNTVLLTGRLLSSTGDEPWNEAAIDLRTAELTEALLRIWTVPGGHLGEVMDPKDKPQDDVQLRDLLAEDLLSSGSALYARQGPWGEQTALIRDDGTLELDGQVFDTPSGAGRHLRGGATNGWSFWRLADGRSLSDLRAELRRRKTHPDVPAESMTGSV